MESEVKEYPKFVASMRKTHTILIPSMLPFHMALFEKALLASGYKVEIMSNEGPDVVTEGLKYVHNDTCYPALLVIGQFIDNLNHRDDLDHVVLLITQTGGGCRASNYIHLLRKALEKAGYGYIPVVSLNASNLEKDSGLRLTLPLIKKVAAAMTYGDEIMYLYNKTRSYEIHSGSAKALAEEWVKKIDLQFDHKKGVSYRALRKNLNAIAKSFDELELDLSKAIPKVGVVGEIYVKYAALGNNHQFYGHGKMKKLVSKLLIGYLRRREKLMIHSIRKTKITPMKYFSHTKDLSEGILSHGTKMGEGWLLTAEMMELVEIGYDNIVCTQPFGCLPNHICGKGVMKKIKSLHPEANIVAIDYDPSATKVNQENRIKLMLAIAREKIEENEDAKL